MVENESWRTYCFLVPQGYLLDPKSHPFLPFPSISHPLHPLLPLWWHHGQTELQTPDLGTTMTSAQQSTGSCLHAGASLPLLVWGKNLETATYGASGEYFQGLENGRGTRTTSRLSQLCAQIGFGD